jgi:hypothetical protein
MLGRKIPDARISIFQYSESWFEKGSVNQRLDIMANKLLYGLDRMRRAVRLDELLVQTSL